MKDKCNPSGESVTGSSRCNVKRYLLAIGLGLIVFTIYVLQFGLWPKFYDIEWDEEVQLHDGRLIMVHIKRTYERRGMRLEQYPEDPRQISMGFSFDTGRQNIFEHIFKRGTLHFLDEKDGKWYIGYNADSGDNSVEIGTRSLYPHVAILHADGSIDKPNNWYEIPAEIKSANILPATPNPNIISKFNKKKLTVVEKMAHWNKYPTGSGWGTIQRITPQPQPIPGGEAK